MATSTVKTFKQSDIKHATAKIYTGPSEYTNHIGPDPDTGKDQKLILNIPDNFSFVYITITMYEGEKVGGLRRSVIVPFTGTSNLAASYYPYAYSGGVGYVRLDILRDNDETSNTFGKYMLTIISATASSLCVATVDAYY